MVSLFIKSVTGRKYIEERTGNQKETRTWWFGKLSAYAGWKKIQKLRDSVRKTCSGENVKDMHGQYFVNVLKGSKNQSTPSQISLKRLGLWLMYPFSHLRSQKWRWVYPRKICREASCLMERIPQTHAGDSPRFWECYISI